MFCPKCGKEIKNDSAVCFSCGCSLEGYRIDYAYACSTVYSDEKASKQLYYSTYKKVYAAVKSVINDEYMIKDILQDAYIKGFKSIKQLKDPNAFPAWIKTIALNTAKDRLRNRKPEIFMTSLQDDEGNEYEFEDTDPDRMPDVVMDRKDLARIMDILLQEIPEAQRICLTMKYYNRMDVRAIAESLSCNEQTVKSRLSLGRNKLRNMIEKRGYKFYSLAPVPFFIAVLRNLEKAVPAEYADPSMISAIAKGAGTAAAVSGAVSASASASVSGSAAKTGAQIAGSTVRSMTATGAAKAAAAGGTAKVISLGVGAKIAIAAVIASAGISVTAVGAAVYNNTRPQQEAQVEYVREVVEKKPKITPEATPQITPVATPTPVVTETPSPTPTPAPKPTVTPKQEALNAYADFLYSYDVSDQVPIPRFKLGYVDEDDIPELFISVHEYGDVEQFKIDFELGPRNVYYTNPNFKVYSYTDGEVRYLMEINSYSEDLGATIFSEKENMIYSFSYAATGVTWDIYSIMDGQAVMIGTTKEFPRETAFNYVHSTDITPENISGMVSDPDSYTVTKENSM